MLTETQTDAEGRYQIKLEGITSKTHVQPYLIARAAGSALAWKSLNLDAADTEASFELKPEQPVTGRLVDIEGQAAVGVHLRVGSVMKRVTDGQWSDEGVRFYDGQQPPMAWPQSIVTDNQGRFTIDGIPKDHGVFLVVEGNERFAPQSVSLNTGLAEQRGERDGTYRPQVVKNLNAGDEAVLRSLPRSFSPAPCAFKIPASPPRMLG